MKYILLIYSPEDAWTAKEWNECVDCSLGICHELAAKGQLLSASPLLPVATGATVRVRSDQRLITAGPFAETTEQLGGYYLIDVDNLDDAIEIASRLPPAKKGTVEIRPLCKVDGLPTEKFEGPLMDASAKLLKFMCLCYDEQGAWEPAGQGSYDAHLREVVALAYELDSRGRYVSASRLHPPSIATSIRVRNDRRIVSDGPFAEMKEALTGFYIVLAKNQEEALLFASKHAVAQNGAVEVRQIFEVSLLDIQPTNK